MVSDAVYKPDTAGVYGAAGSGMEEVSAVVWLWGAAGISLDIVLW